MKKLLAFTAFVLCSSAAHAQTPGAQPEYCVTSQSQTANYNQLCISASLSGGAIAVHNFGSATGGLSTSGSLSVSGNLATNITGSTQCLQVSTSGVVSGTGATCGSGGGALANPSSVIGLAAVNGVATSGMRSDGAPALSQAIVPTWTGLHTFSAGATVSTTSGSVPLLIVNNSGSAASGSNLAEMKWSLSAGSSAEAVAFVQGGASPIFQISSASGLTGGMNFVAVAGQATFQSLTGVVQLIGQTGMSLQVPTGTAVASYNPGGPFGFTVPIAIVGVAGNQINSGSINTGNTNSIVLFNGGTPTNSGTIALFEAVLTSLSGGDLQITVTGDASNPFASVVADTGLTGGLKLTASGGPLTLSGTSFVMTTLPGSAGGGGLYMCVDTSGVLYKKSACP